MLGPTMSGFQVLSSGVWLRYWKDGVAFMTFRPKPSGRRTSRPARHSGYDIFVSQNLPGNKHSIAASLTRRGTMKAAKEFLLRLAAECGGVILLGVPLCTRQLVARRRAAAPGRALTKPREKETDRLARRVCRRIATDRVP